MQKSFRNAIFALALALVSSGVLGASCSDFGANINSASLTKNGSSLVLDLNVACGNSLDFNVIRTTLYYSDSTQIGQAFKTAKICSHLAGSVDFNSSFGSFLTTDPNEGTYIYQMDYNNVAGSPAISCSKQGSIVYLPRKQASSIPDANIFSAFAALAGAALIIAFARKK